MIRYYYTHPIKALYMMKEFEVEFECLSDETVIVDGIEQKDELFYDFADWGVDAEMISDLLELFEGYPKRIYVKPKSEHIFEPKEGDLDADGFSFTKGMPVINHMTGKIDYYTDACWLIKIEEFTESKEKSKTIFRNNKQFFMPEVKNENN